MIASEPRACCRCSGASSARTARGRGARSSWCWSCCGALGAPDRAAGPLRPRRSRACATRAGRRAMSAPAATRIWLGTDAQGRDLLSAHPLRPAHLASDGPDRRRLRPVPSARRSACVAAFLGGRVESADHAHRRPAALLPGDPAGARPRRRCSARARPSSSLALVAAQYAYFARTAHGAALAERAQGLCRGGAVDAAAGARVDLPPYPAQLPAAADRRRDRAGRQRDLARGDAVLPRPRPAADGAVARHADRQRLPVHDVRPLLDLDLSRRRADHR